MQKSFLWAILIASIIVLSGCSDESVSEKTHDVKDTTSPEKDTISPIFTSGATAEVEEKQFSAITLVATDDTIISYAMDGIDAQYFHIDSTTGVVTFKILPEHLTKSSYIFIAKATDVAGNVTTQDISIDIISLPDNNSRIAICNTSGLTFDYLSSGYTLAPWIENDDGRLNSTRLRWNPVADAKSYEYDIRYLSTNWLVDNVNAHTANNIQFQYDKKVHHLWSMLGSDITLSSKYLNTNNRVIVTMRALDANGNTLVEAEPLSIVMAKSYISYAPEKLWG